MLFMSTLSEIQTIRSPFMRGIAAMRARDNVRFLPERRVTELLGTQRLEGIVLQSTASGSTEQLAVDGCFISIGRDPVTDTVRGQLALDGAGYVIADESTKTSLAGVFAAGDIRTKPLRQIVTATADGATAAYFAEQYLRGL